MSLIPFAPLLEAAVVQSFLLCSRPRRVTFPLRYELRNGPKHSSGKIDKMLMLEPGGDELQIVAASERKAE